MHYLALCCIAKDEDPFLREWITYHSLLGVEHFYIYDNCSKTPIRETLAEYAHPDRVTIRRIQGRPMQLPAYDDCLQSFGNVCRWIGFIDIDEFVCLPRENDLRVLLSEFEPYGGLAATWQLFGPSGHLKRPDGPVLRNYTEAFAVQESYTTKCFVRPEKTDRALSPHHFRFKPGHFCVNEEHYPMSPGLRCTFARGERIRINHYFVRSQQDFEEKLLRGRGANADPAAAYQHIMFYESARRECVTDVVIQRFLPDLEESLAARTLPPVSPLLPPDAPYEAVMHAAMKFLDAGLYEQALACLCTANPEHDAKADLWTLRALIAQQAGDLRRADVYLRQSLIREPSRTGHAQLERLLKALGRDALAGDVSAVLRRYPEEFT